ncbi:MAG: hypothetical protein KDD76_06660 [Rickettsiales bacterium]|nr:hypothetical protein [Rickettsiales bacterium]
MSGKPTEYNDRNNDGIGERNAPVDALKFDELQIREQIVLQAHKLAQTFHDESSEELLIREKITDYSKQIKAAKTKNNELLSDSLYQAGLPYAQRREEIYRSVAEKIVPEVLTPLLEDVSINKGRALTQEIFDYEGSITFCAATACFPAKQAITDLQLSSTYFSYANVVQFYNDTKDRVSFYTMGVTDKELITNLHDGHKVKEGGYIPKEGDIGIEFVMGDPAHAFVITEVKVHEDGSITVDRLDGTAIPKITSRKYQSFNEMASRYTDTLFVDSIDLIIKENPQLELLPRIPSYPVILGKSYKDIQKLLMDNGTAALEKVLSEERISDAGVGTVPTVKSLSNANKSNGFTLS